MQLQKAFIPIMLAALLAGIIIGSSFRSCRSRQQKAEPVVIHDTISVSDTIIREKTKILWRDWVDTCIVHVHDSIVDTIKVEIPIDHKLYADQIKADSGIFDLGIKYSGYKASLDSIGISYYATIQPSVIQKKRGIGQFVGIGIGVGYGGSLIDQRVYAAPYVGVHITYGFGYTWRK